jgi:hypothetical protein
MKIDDFTRRFNELVGDNRMEFSFKTLIPYTTVTNIQKGTEPRLGAVLSVLNAYPRLSAEWLLRGVEPKFMNDGQEKEDSQEVKSLKAELEQLKGKYNLLKEMYDDKCAELAVQTPHVAYVLRKEKSSEENR